MDAQLNSLNNAVINPILGTLSKHLTLPDLAELYLLTIAAVSLNRQTSLFHFESDTYGLFRVTETQHQTLWDEHLVKDPDLASKVRGLASQHQFLQSPHQELNINLNYATAIAAFALSLLPKSFEVGLSLHQQIALINEVFPGFKGISRREWQNANHRLRTQGTQACLLSPAKIGSSVAECA
ncbi:hypothetical protein [Litoribrevibacter albus]|uniref:Uncharacterized protein n=1 Tax=Litoribrevibacter albus TaxID=1473156 RepID=A0AA37SC78_9GAMM|nr:hypothetical protein [Litoribrevibacter albus]GLQ32108.1 hypothetical protein GCM10007876_25870 [Litoribrevibacter albus]